jgi:two-component system CheB/CheR fusion protein
MGIKTKPGQNAKEPLKSAVLKNKISNQNHYFIAIGISAGGLDALIELLEHSEKLPVSFIIIQHLPSDYKSQAKEVLEKHTSLSILEITDQLVAEKNKIYLAPGAWNVSLINGVFSFVKKPEGHNTPIDFFLTSLAADKKEKAIAIILSGSGSDGSKGIKAIKEVGGLVIAQEPETAAFDNMPKNAIATGFVDVALTPEEMLKEISTYLKNPAILDLYRKNLTEQDQEELISILHFIRDHSGKDFTNYKRPTLIRRLNKRMLHLSINNYKDYRQYLSQNKEEVEIISDEFLISVTKFFRDPEAFKIIEEIVIPKLFKKRPITDQVRVWVAGCCTGEEAYSIAILIREYLDSINKDFDIRILASDIDKKALEVATKGIYPAKALQDVPSNILNSYFSTVGKNYSIIPRIRKMIIFSEHDLTNDPPFSKMDLICCRNVLIYMNSELQKRIFNTFHGALKLGGYLFLGPSENHDPLRSYFQNINLKWKIYQNIQISRGLWYIPSSAGKQSSNRLNPLFSSGSQNKNIYSENIAEAILEEHDTAGVCINSSYEIIRAFGPFKNYLHLPEKMWGFNLLKMVPEELSIALSSGIQKVIKSAEKLTIKNIKIRSNKTTRNICVVIKSFSASEDKQNPVFLILMKDESEARISSQNQEVFNKEIYFNERLSDLETELKNTKEHLHTTIEELEVANEELQSANEELLSANEEMQSTNEELQSLNEELVTVNNEHEYKITELIDLNDELDNYFRASDVSQIFVDKNLTIRKFTPSSKQQINLIEADIGRPINHISTNILYDDLIEDLIKVIRSSTTIEKTVKTKNNKWFQMKIIPYIKKDKFIDGSIITFTDITKDLKIAETNTIEKLIQQKDILNAVIETQEAERKRIGESLHNGLGQILYSVKLKIDGIDKHTDPQKLKKINEETQAMLLEAIKETRSISSQLMPTILEDYGLAIAIDSLCKKLKDTLKIRCNITGFEKRIETKYEIGIFRIVQELLNNIIKHADASSVGIILQNMNNKIHIMVKDNGVGFNKTIQPSGVGLSSIKSRVKLFEGSLKIASKKNQGTEVNIQFQI